MSRHTATEVRDVDKYRYMLIKGNAINTSKQFIIDNPGLKIKDEGYILEVTKENLIKVIASSSSGLFYAFQSFRQLLDPNIEIGRKKNFKITN